MGGGQWYVFVDENCMLILRLTNKLSREGVKIFSLSRPKELVEQGLELIGEGSQSNGTMPCTNRWWVHFSGNWRRVRLGTWRDAKNFASTWTGRTCWTGWPRCLWTCTSVPQLISRSSSKSGRRVGTYIYLTYRGCGTGTSERGWWTRTRTSRRRPSCSGSWMMPGRYGNVWYRKTGTWKWPSNKTIDGPNWPKTRNDRRVQYVSVS